MASKYTSKKADAILDAIADGAALRGACREQEIAASTFLRWCDARPPLAERYARAREAQFDAWADEILEISDDGSNDTYEDDGRTLTNQDVVQRSRLRVDSRKWLLSKLKPERYGDKKEVNGNLKGDFTCRWANDDEEVDG